MVTDATPLSASYSNTDRGVVSTQHLPSHDTTCIYLQSSPHLQFLACTCKGDPRLANKVQGFIQRGGALGFPPDKVPPEILKYDVM